jgi:hypothetical protein
VILFLHGARVLWVIALLEDSSSCRELLSSTSRWFCAGSAFQDSFPPSARCYLASGIRCFALAGSGPQGQASRTLGSLFSNTNPPKYGRPPYLDKCHDLLNFSTVQFGFFQENHGSGLRRGKKTTSGSNPPATFHLGDLQRRPVTHGFSVAVPENLPARPKRGRENDDRSRPRWPGRSGGRRAAQEHASPKAPLYIYLEDKMNVTRSSSAARKTPSPDPLARDMSQQATFTTRLSPSSVWASRAAPLRRSFRQHCLPPCGVPSARIRQSVAGGFETDNPSQEVSKRRVRRIRGRHGRVTLTNTTTPTQAPDAKTHFAPSPYTGGDMLPFSRLPYGQLGLV